MLFDRELRRIHFRQAVLSLPGGAAWLCVVGRLFGYDERFFGPGDVGMPNVLRVAMHRLGW